MKTPKLENAPKLLDNESLKIKVRQVGNRDEDRLLESEDNDIELLEVEGRGDQINNKARKLEPEDNRTDDQVDREDVVQNSIGQQDRHGEEVPDATTHHEIEIESL
ncbi:hypothetical protein [Litorimonas sp.]|uniref:hypothetical protein n=1 Tax=Litorimonas sp. TaxID=1892381 RepID=UPI003A8B4257